MVNVMEIDGVKAVVDYDPELGMFRGEFVGLNGGADFYARDVEGLRREGGISLEIFLDACERRGIEPRKAYSGKFNVRVPIDLHEAIAHTAAAQGKSLNRWVVEALREAVRE